jgi:hypothetical protein
MELVLLYVNRIYFNNILGIDGVPHGVDVVAQRWSMKPGPGKPPSPIRWFLAFLLARSLMTPALVIAPWPPARPPTTECPLKNKDRKYFALRTTHFFQSV